ncbi:hypothetical protein [Pseudorhodoplanes sp.]|uniref:hypothetical protein n=1 Tax=Pseudorhodoplanes sp. TaxID=1934341 RepID=UPI003918AEF6
MDQIDVIPGESCPVCQERMMVRAYLPANGELPAVAGYRCEKCQKEVTLEIDRDD